MWQAAHENSGTQTAVLPELGGTGLAGERSRESRRWGKELVLLRSTGQRATFQTGAVWSNGSGQLEWLCVAGAEGGGHKRQEAGTKSRRLLGVAGDLTLWATVMALHFRRVPLAGMVQLGSGDGWALGDGCSLPVRETVGA